MGKHCVCECPDDEAVAVDKSVSEMGMVVVTYECPPCGCRWEVTF